MKRNIFSVLLVCLMIVSVCVLSGCKVDDLEAQVNENASAAEGAVSDAINKAEDAVDAAAKQAAANLAAAKEELTKLIADGANADADALEAAVADFNAAIAEIEAVMAAGEEAAKDHDEAAAAELAALKAELTTAIEDASNAVAGVAAQELAAVKADLLAAIAAGHAASSADISAAVAAAVEDLTALIATVQDANLAYTDAVKAELEANFAEALEEVADTAAAELDAAVADVNAAVALKADATALEAAVKEYKELVAAAEAAAALADEALKAELVTKVDALKLELVAKIEAADAALEVAVKKVADDLTAATAKLDAAIALKADATALEAAVKEYKELVAAATVAATAADGALKTELVAKIDAADAKLEAAVKKVADDLAASTAKLDAAIALKADATVLDATKKDLQDQIDYLESVVGTLSGSTTDGLGNLQEYIDSKLASAKAAADAAYIVIEAWDKATEAVIDAIVEITEVWYEDVNYALYYEEQWYELDAIYEAFKIRILRAANEDAVKALVNKANEDGFYAAIDAVETKADIIYATLTAEGTTVEEVLLNKEWKKAISDAANLIADEYEAGNTDALKSLNEVIKLATDFVERYEFLEEQDVAAKNINARVEALIAAIKANGYTAANKAEYEAIVKAIADWDKAVGAANAALINREKAAALDTDYAAAKAAYEKAVADMKALLDSFTSYTYSAEAYAAITKADAAYTTWKNDVTARGFEADKAVVDAYTAFAKVLARAEALETANAQATAIEKLIADLTAELENLTVVKVQYQKDYSAIKGAVQKWNADYFTDYQAEAVAGNANYDLLDHAAYDKLTALYNEKVAAVLALVDALDAALAKLDNVTIYSGADIEAAKAAYVAFTNKLGDLKCDLGTGHDTLEQMTDKIAAKTVEYNALLAKADGLFVAAPAVKDVTLNSGDVIANLKNWYNTYALADLTKADSAVKFEVKLGTNTVNADTLAAAKAAVAAFDELTAAKLEEFEALIKEMTDLAAKNASTALRDKIDTAFDNYEAWLAGANAPEGYAAAQFIPVDGAALNLELGKLNDLNDKVEALEKRLADLKDAIDKLELDFTKIADTVAAQTTLDTLKDDIATFTADNDKVECFADDAETLAAAQVAIDKAEELAVFAQLLADLKAGLAGDEKVKASIAKRGEIAFDTVKLAISVGDEATKALVKANFALLETIDANYQLAYAVNADKANEAYLILAERAAMTNADQLADEQKFVKDFFAAIK